MTVSPPSTLRAVSVAHNISPLDTASTTMMRSGFKYGCNPLGQSGLISRPSPIQITSVSRFDAALVANKSADTPVIYRHLLLDTIAAGVHLDRARFV